MKVAVVVFPGSNCDQDCRHAFADVLGLEVRMVWHRDTDLAGADLVVLPGGFSYGDYLRAGAIARFSPVMAAVREHAARGGLVLGICNGFQVLLEAGLLPGAMRHNASRRFLCRDVHLKVERYDTPFTRGAPRGQALRVPIAHAEGNWVIPEADLPRLEDNGQILLRYCTPDGAVTPAANPNGSLGNVAGVTDPTGRILGLMPHPERAAETALGCDDGLHLLRSILRAA